MADKSEKSKKKQKPKKTEKTFKKAVYLICRHLRDHFYLNLWTMNLVWSLNEYKSGDGGGSIAAEITFNEAYLTFTIVLYRRAYDAYLDGQLYDVLLHEFCHHVIDPLYLMTIDHVGPDLQPLLHQLRERQTEFVTKLLKDKSIPAIRRFDV